MGRCKGCRKLVGNSSQSNDEDPQPCFFKVLIGNFTKKLWIPPRFAEYLTTGRATLRGPSDNIWNVSLERKDRSFFFGKGWREFVIHHELNTSDFLMFTYDGGLEFNVLIFDSSGCQREDAFYARNLANACENEGQNQGQNAGKSFVEVTAQPRGASSGISKEVRIDCNSVEIGETSSQQRQEQLREYSLEVIPKPEKAYEEATLVIQSVHSDPKLNMLGRDNCIPFNDRYKRSAKPSAYRSQSCKANEKAAKVGGRRASGAEVGPQNQTGAKSLSRSQPAMSKGKKSRPLMLASSFHSRHPFFISPMHQSCVSNPFKLHIPAKFARKHLGMMRTEVTLRNAVTGEWTVTCLHCKERGLVLSGGWPHFVHAHSLVEGDVCVFELLEEEGLLLNVIIYRMADESVLLPAGEY